MKYISTIKTEYQATDSEREILHPIVDSHLKTQPPSQAMIPPRRRRIMQNSPGSLSISSIRRKLTKYPIGDFL